MRVGLVGKAGVGKSSLAQHWKSQYGARILSLAAGPKTQLYLAGLPETRENLQALAMFFRGLDKEIWIRNLLRRVDQYKSHELVVVDDVRFLNELQELGKAGFTFLKVARPEKDRLTSRPEMKGPAGKHVSETELDAVKHWPNTVDAKSLDQLFDRADKWLLKNTDGVPHAMSELDQPRRKLTKDDIYAKLDRVMEEAFKTVISDGATDLAKQKASRIIIHAAKAYAQLGLEEVKAENILDLIRGKARRVGIVIEE